MLPSQIYQYVFGGLSIINDSKVPDDKKEQFKQEKKQNIKKLFASILKTQPLTFRKLLRSVQSKELEIILFDNNQDDLGELPSFPKDEEISQEFYRLNENEKMGFYFSSLEMGEYKKTFIELYKGYQLVAKFIEHNDNGQLGFIHAYKTLVLFGSQSKTPCFANIELFIKKFNLSHTSKPIHDVFAIDFPANTQNIDLAIWQKLIAKHGKKAINYFLVAQDIKAKLGRDPQDFNEAATMASQLQYARYDEYPELAELCIKHQISENIFNECLEIEKIRKKVDQLPNVIVHGHSLGYADYYLAKLPIDDPRAYILGYLTACCQSIGSDGHECVKNGITKENHGFYVLLKKTNKKANTVPMIDGKINYNDFKIVGQGYAWLSWQENMTFDSWENLHPEDNQIALSLLELLGKKITSDEQSSITRLTIGLGGKTPEEFNDRAISLLERIENQFYDSSEQAIVYQNLDKIQTIKQEFESFLFNINTERKNEWDDALLTNDNFFTSRLYLQGFKTLLHYRPSLNTNLKDIDNLKFVIKHHPHIFIYILKIALLLANKELFNAMLNIPLYFSWRDRHKFNSLYEYLIFMDNNFSLTEDVANKILLEEDLDVIKNKLEIHRLLKQRKYQNPNTQDFLDLTLNNLSTLKENLEALIKNDLATVNNINLLLLKRCHEKHLSFDKLTSIDNEAIDAGLIEKILQLPITSSKQREVCKKTISFLSELNSQKILNEKTKELAFIISNYDIDQSLLCMYIKAFSQNNILDDLSIDQLNNLQNQGKSLWGIMRGVATLSSNQLLTVDYFNFLASFNSDDTDTIADILCYLHQINLPLNDKIKSTMLTYTAPQVSKLASCFYTIKKDAITQKDIILAILNNPENSTKILQSGQQPPPSVITFGVFNAPSSDSNLPPKLSP